MKKSLMMSVRNPAFWVQLAVASLASAQTVDQLIPHNVKLESSEYLAKRAVKITEDGQVGDGEAYAIVKGSAFHNGTIDVELAGRPAPAAARAVSLESPSVFRTASTSTSTCVRPTAGRMIKSAAIIPRSTARTRNSDSRCPASSRRRSTRVTWTSIRASGPATASRSKARRPACTSIAPASPV